MNPNKRIVTLITFITSAWVSTASAILIVLALYRTEDKPDLVSFLEHFDGSLFMGGVSVFLCSNIIAIRYWVKLRRSGMRPLRLIFIWNILPLVLIGITLEIFLRLLASETPTGTMLGGKPLFPRSLRVFADNSVWEPLLSYDHTLGWTVTPNSSTSDGLYISSEDGIRTSKTSSGFGAGNAICRIALIGDSHTFGLEMKFEETWGYLLQRYMPECQVLNFGVSGYSLSQMYLRYKRDVLPFRPDIVILALSRGSTNRTMGVYGLTMFSPGIPWAQPRFQITNAGLTPINQPLPRLEDIIQAKWISDLPYIDYDRFFSPSRWELKRWRYFYNSYLFRLYTTRYPLGRKQRKEDSAEMLNHALLQGVFQVAKAYNSIPLLLYLPDKNDANNLASETPSLKVLRSSGFQYLDLRPCLSQLSAEDRFIPNGSHYSIRGSEAIAACVANHLFSVRKQVNYRTPGR
ncbi:MAG: hypothetical protein KF722_18530 [Nitrospira sp.]|nr:hypothetical protein [Nitrospira sp.]